EFHEVQAYDPVVPILVRDWPSVIDHDPLVRSGSVDHGMVSGPCGDVALLGFQNGPDPGIGADRTLRHGIGHLIASIGPVSFGPHEIIDALSLEHKGAFHIALWGDFPEEAPILPGDKARKVGIEPSQVAMAPAPVKEVVGAPILEDELVYGLGIVVELGNQGFSKIVPKRTPGTIGHGQTDSPKMVDVVVGVVEIPAGALDVVGPEEQKVVIVLFYDGGGP